MHTRVFPRFVAFSSALFVMLLGGVATLQVQQKGGEDETGPYEAVAGWPQPWTQTGYIWGSQPGVFAESPNRIFLAVRGELKLPERPGADSTASGDRSASVRRCPRPKCATACSWSTVRVR